MRSGECGVRNGERLESSHVGCCECYKGPETAEKGAHNATLTLRRGDRAGVECGNTQKEFQGEFGVRSAEWGEEGIRRS